MTEHRSLREREKELRCLYAIHDILRDRDQSPVEAFARVAAAIPAGWQRNDAAGARIEYLGRSYVGPGFCSASPTIAEPIRVWGVEFGRVEVSDTSAPDLRDEPVFLPEEATLLRNIAARLGEYLEWKQTELLGRRPTRALHGEWREAYVRALGAQLDADRFCVDALYLGGSTENGAAGPSSDVDLFLVFRGSPEQRRELAAWLDGWSRALAEVAHQQTGFAFPNGLLDVHWLDEPPDRHRRHELSEIPLHRG